MQNAGCTVHRWRLIQDSYGLQCQTWTKHGEFQGIRKLEATCLVLIFSLRNSLLANNKVPRSSPGGVTGYFSFFRIRLATVEFRRENSSTRHVASNFLRIAHRNKPCPRSYRRLELLEVLDNRAEIPREYTNHRWVL